MSNLIVSRDHTFHNLRVTNGQKVPVYSTLSGVGDYPGQEGNIIFNRADGTFYGHDGFTWIALGGLNSIQNLETTLAEGIWSGPNNIAMLDVFKTTGAVGANTTSDKQIYGDFGHILLSNTSGQGIFVNGNQGTAATFGDGNAVRINGGGTTTGTVGGGVYLSGGKPPIIGNGSGGLIDIRAESSRGTGIGGLVTIVSGTGGATGSGGSIINTAGAGGSTSGNGGSYTITAGSSTSGNGGTYQCVLGSSGGGGSGGFYSIITGDSTSDGAGGSFTVDTGDGGDSVNVAAGSAGSVIFTMGRGGNGNVTSSMPSQGGNFSVACGDTGTPDPTYGGAGIHGGLIQFSCGTGAPGTGAALSGDGGSFQLETGNSGPDSGSGRGNGGRSIILTGAGERSGHIEFVVGASDSVAPNPTLGEIVFVGNTNNPQHLISSRGNSAAPTIGSPIGATSASINSISTDTAGKINFFGLSGGTNASVPVVFNKAYAAVPIVVVSGNNQTASSFTPGQPYVTNLSPFGFTMNTGIQTNAGDYIVGYFTIGNTQST